MQKYTHIECVILIFYTNEQFIHQTLHEIQFAGCPKYMCHNVLTYWNSVMAAVLWQCHLPGSGEKSGEYNIGVKIIYKH